MGSKETSEEVKMEEGHNDIEEKKKEAEEKEELLTYVEEMRTKLSSRGELRKVNLAAATERPELDTSKLDSSLKKNTAFIKKMRNLTESQRDVLEKELSNLNLTKYVSELAQAVVDARMKMSDVSTAVHICSLLHQRYQDFSSTLLDCWYKLLSWKKDEKISNISKLRVDLRLYAELVSAGIFSQKDGLPILGNSLKTIVNCDKEDHQNISVVVAFCRHCGHDYVGIHPRKFRMLADKFAVDIPSSDFLPKERQKNVGNLMKEYFSSLAKHLIAEYTDLCHAEKQNARILRTKGELSEQRRSLIDSMSASFSKLLSNATVLADLLDCDVPSMPNILRSECAEEEGYAATTKEEVFGGGKTEEATPDDEAALWDDDEDSRTFYTSLPQLKALLPSILYAESEQVTLEDGDAEKEELQEGDVLDDELVEEEEEEEEEGRREPSSPPPPPPELVEEEEEVLVDDSTTCSSSSSSSANKIILEGFLNALPNCVSRDLIDSAALEFCLKLNTRPFRKRLVRTMFAVPRTRLDLLPFYARLAATLRPLMPEVASDLAFLLKQDFRYQVKKKDQINIETKIKVVRFIGELTKFGVFARSDALLCLRMLLNDFKHHHIEMTCNLLETCGRYLYRSPQSHHRTKFFMEQMMRKKMVRSFDPRHNTMIENAFYHVNPPESSADHDTPELPPMLRYIRRLLYVSLKKTNTERILRQIRKLHWEQEEVWSYAVACFSSPWNANFYYVRCIANLLAGLTFYYDWIGTAVVDNVLEDIRVGMESNDPKYNQRRVACVKYLGELYNYRVIESAIVFKVLYSLITFGVSWDASSPSEYDPPDHLLRLRLACTLLDSCGQFFNSGASKRRLDCYIVYLQHYLWFKKSFYPAEEFPWQVDHMVRDTIFALRPKLKLFGDLQEALEAVAKLNRDLFDKAVRSLPTLKLCCQEPPQSHDQSPPLPPIPEDERSYDNDDERIDFAKQSEFIDLEEEEEDEEEDGGGREWEDGVASEEDLTPSQSQYSQPLNADREESEGEENSVPDGRSGGEDHSGGRQGETSVVTEEPNLDLRLEAVHCPEDDDFMSEFDRMMADNLLERSRDLAMPAHGANISVPLHVRSSAKKSYDQLVNEAEVASGGGDSGSGESSMVKFTLLTKCGSKPQCSRVAMPVDSELVVKLRSREQRERVERDRVKQLTLEINERQEEEEEALEMMQQKTQNANRDRKPRYQHPKGAPDADLIFGSKKPR